MDLLDTSGWSGDWSNEQLLAWSWTDDDQRSLIVIDDADRLAAGRVDLPWDDLAAHRWQLTDLLTDEMFTRDGPEMADAGLYVQLSPWGFHVLGAARFPPEVRSPRCPSRPR